MGNRYDITGIGKRIKQRRKTLGLSQSALAGAMGLNTDRRTIGNWESGSTKPGGAETYISLCDVLDCDMEYLFGNSKTPHKETASAMEITGLSEKAIDTLRSLNSGANAYAARKEDIDKSSAIWGDAREAITGRYSLYALQFLNALICSDSIKGIALAFTEWKRAAQSALDTFNSIASRPYLYGDSDKMINAERFKDAERYSLAQGFECFVNEIGADYEPQKKGVKNGKH